MRASSNASKPHSYGESFSGSGRCTPSNRLAPPPISGKATPIASPTQMNIRIGKYCCSMSLSGPIPFQGKAPARIARAGARAQRPLSEPLHVARYPSALILPASADAPHPSQGMVPMVRLELTRLSPPPPQDGVSTNFTTSAISPHRPGSGGRRAPPARSLRNVLGLRIPCCRRGLSRFRWGRGSLGGWPLGRRHVHDAARLRLVADHVGETHAGQKEHGSQHCRGAAEKVGRTRRAEQAARGTAAERRTHVRTLAVL